MAGGPGLDYSGTTPLPMIITLTVIALLIQFIGVYALVIHAQRTQESEGDEADPACQRGRQVYYNAFRTQPPFPRN